MAVGSFEALAARIRALPVRAGATRVVAVDGPAGSGKTSFAAQLADALDAPVVHLDDLCPGWDGLPEVAPRLQEWNLIPLAEHRPARYRTYNWTRPGPRADVLTSRSEPQ